MQSYTLVAYVLIAILLLSAVTAPYRVYRRYRDRLARAPDRAQKPARPKVELDFPEEWRAFVEQTMTEAVRRARGVGSFYVRVSDEDRLINIIDLMSIKLSHDAAKAHTTEGLGDLRTGLIAPVVTGGQAVSRDAFLLIDSIESKRRTRRRVKGYEISSSTESENPSEELRLSPLIRNQSSSDV